MTALREQQAELSALLDGLADDDWDRPSACEGWTVADVVVHLAHSNEATIASATHAFAPVDEPVVAGTVDAWVDASVAAQRGAPPAEVLHRWHRSADEVVDVLASCDPSERLQWVAGTLAARSLATARLSETWIHTGDVFHAFGGGPPPTDRLWHIARLAHRTLPYAFTTNGLAMGGPVAFELVAPSGAPWRFGDGDAPTVIRGAALDLCMVAARRVPAAATDLQGEGPDAAAVLEVVRTWA